MKKLLLLSMFLILLSCGGSGGDSSSSNGGADGAICVYFVINPDDTNEICSDDGRVKLPSEPSPDFLFWNNEDGSIFDGNRVLEQSIHVYATYGKKIRTIADLKNINDNASYLLMNDIDISNLEWVPIRVANIHLYGNNKTITGLTINTDSIFSETDSLGFFSFIASSKIQDLRISSLLFNIDLISDFGTLAGATHECDIVNVEVNGDIFVNLAKNYTNYFNVGGIVGQAYKTKIINSSHNGNIIVDVSNSGRTRVGGISASLQFSELINVVHVGDIKTNAWSYTTAGGIVASSHSSSIDKGVVYGNLATTNEHCTGNVCALSAGLLGTATSEDSTVSNSFYFGDYIHSESCSTMSADTISTSAAWMLIRNTYYKSGAKTKIGSINVKNSVHDGDYHGEALPEETLVQKLSEFFQNEYWTIRDGVPVLKRWATPEVTFVHNDKVVLVVNVSEETLEMNFPDDPKSNNPSLEFIGWSTHSSGKSELLSKNSKINSSITAYAIFGKKISSLLEIKNMKGVYFIKEDINLLGTWTHLGDKANPFSGVIYGNNKKVANLSIDITEGTKAIFEYVNNAYINDLYIDVSITGVALRTSVYERFYVGVIGGYIENSTLENIHTTVDIDLAGASHLGGIAGGASNTNVYKCSVKGNLNNKTIIIGRDNSSAGRTGGLFGVFSGAMTSSYANVNVHSEYAAGLFLGGSSAKLLKNSYAAGKLTAKSYAYGIASIRHINIDNVISYIEEIDSKYYYSSISDYVNDFEVNLYTNANAIFYVYGHTFMLGEKKILSEMLHNPNFLKSIGWDLDIWETDRVTGYPILKNKVY